MTRSEANTTYDQADLLDSQMKYRQCPTRVRIESVFKVTEKSYDLLLKQIKNADALAQQSAIGK